jgi:YwiC-like protein
MSRRSLWPREHGAYFQLAVPLITALAMRVPSSAGVALAVASCLAFLAHEPLLVRVGLRGPRMQQRDGVRARRSRRALRPR